MIWWTMAWTSGPLFFSSEAKRATIRRFLRVSSLLMSRTTLESKGFHGFTFSMVFLTSSVRLASSALMATRRFSMVVFSGAVFVLAGAASTDGLAVSVMESFFSKVIIGFFSAVLSWRFS